MVAASIDAKIRFNFDHSQPIQGASEQWDDRGVFGRARAWVRGRTVAHSRHSTCHAATRGTSGMVFVDGRGGCSAVTVPYSTDHKHNVGALFGCVSRENGGNTLSAVLWPCPLVHSTSSCVLHGGAAALAAGSPPATRATTLAKRVAQSLLNLDDSAVGTRFRCVFVANMNNVGEHELQGVRVDDL